MTLKRPQWANATPEMQDYYDHYWGFPVHDDQQLFAMLSLELFQAGLTWQTIWRRREAFNQAFNNFKVEKVASFTDEDINRLCEDATIIRNRRKILAVINNAQVILKLRKTGRTFDDYMWNFVDDQPQDLGLTTDIKLAPKTPASEEIAKQMRKDGFKFVGPTIIYSFMTAVGMVNARLK
ncbi:DNA-3-methyladenine glycosylase I [Limosilactobacillus reuteri]|uniref:DNA-3-methyladenine glycosylase I n=1 Tax=Limosilactobacillus reuteri TaxID=1598 RepID=UPI00080C7F20|nr:DNA-3-methyladenine glycosylase I [Limosilactobacillus reuteri]ANU51637.1 3-methyladenine DNA glycosylase [Limosilactobacillus reuteri]OXE60633.1 3-methyladenine DNA glycosylase [Limosilactobacillus reuteri]QQR14403.1 DNA-3-methyladenine glycosylase I [Limosilactobacillus reuteri]